MATDDIFDFGFTAVDESELEAVQQAQETAQLNTTAIISTQEKLNNLYNSILPLLSNLKANPEKDYIYWPNRTAKVEEFEDRLRKIME
tara:strand:+ start:638 stop:901 length:264 start_codon:yes stop_codon:yes gene_type:complete